MIPKVSEELGFYHWVYIPLNFIKEDGVDKREDQVGVQPDPDEEEIKDVVLDDESNHQMTDFLRSPRPSRRLHTYVKLKYQTPCWQKNAT